MIIWSKKKLIQASVLKLFSKTFRYYTCRLIYARFIFLHNLQWSDLNFSPQLAEISRTFHCRLFLPPCRLLRSWPSCICYYFVFVDSPLVLGPSHLIQIPAFRGQVSQLSCAQPRSISMLIVFDVAQDAEISIWIWGVVFGTGEDGAVLDLGRCLSLSAQTYTMFSCFCKSFYFEEALRHLVSVPVSLRMELEITCDISHTSKEVVRDQLCYYHRLTPQSSAQKYLHFSLGCGYL